MQVLEAEVPAEFETLARDSIAKIGRLTGDACYCSNDLYETGPGHIVYGTQSGLDRKIHEHEVGHSVGFAHPSPPAPTLPTFMYDYPYAITSADELHGRILYRRPNGSLTPDRDPAGITIN